MLPQCRLENYAPTSPTSSDAFGVTKNGHLTAVVIGIEDLQTLEELEDARDLAAFREAIRHDDGERVSLADLRAELND